MVSERFLVRKGLLADCEWAAMPRLRLDHASLTLPGRSARSQVLANVSLEVADGERMALRGAPGSGRSSLVRLLAGRLTPTVGAFRVAGSVVAILDVGSALDPEATGRRNLERLAGRRAGEAAGLTGLGDLLDVPVGFCSPGMRWRMGFAAAVRRGVARR